MNWFGWCGCGVETSIIIPHFFISKCTGKQGTFFKVVKSPKLAFRVIWNGLVRILRIITKTKLFWLTVVRISALSWTRVRGSGSMKIQNRVFGSVFEKEISMRVPLWIDEMEEPDPVLKKRNDCVRTMTPCITRLVAETKLIDTPSDAIEAHWNCEFLVRWFRIQNYLQCIENLRVEENENFETIHLWSVQVTFHKMIQVLLLFLFT